MIDIVDVKGAVRSGEIKAYVKDNIIYLTYCNTEETVMIGELEELKSENAHWVGWTDDGNVYVMCSECCYGNEGEVKLKDRTPYCPLCGSKMII